MKLPFCCHQIITSYLGIKDTLNIMQTNKKHSGYLPQNGGMIQEEISWPDKFSLVVKESVNDPYGSMYSGAMKVFKFLATNNQPGNHAIFAMHALPFNESVELLKGQGFNHMREVMKPYINKVVRLCIEETGCEEWLDMQYRTTTSSFFVPLVLTNCNYLPPSFPQSFEQMLLSLTPTPLCKYNKESAVNVLLVILTNPKLTEETTQYDIPAYQTLLREAMDNLNNNFASPSKNDIRLIHSISKNKCFADDKIFTYIEYLESLIDTTNKGHINCVANNFGKFVDALFRQVEAPVGANQKDQSEVKDQNNQTSKEKQDIISNCSKLAQKQWDHIHLIPYEYRVQFLLINDTMDITTFVTGNIQTQNEIFINEAMDIPTFVTGNIQLDLAGQTQTVTEAEN